MDEPETRHGSTVTRRLFRAVVVFVVGSLFVPVTAAGTVLVAFLFLPLPAVIPTPRIGIDSQISHIYDIDGAEIGVFRTFETSVPFRKEDIPEVLKHAVIVAEDRNFYRHGGVDVQGTLRALWADVRNRSPVQGGSTITQQYVKNAFTGSQRTITRKIREAILASQLDRQMEKDEILYRYLSSVYLGNGAYGVEAASELYFRKSVRDLTTSEAALLAGLIPAPSRYEPLGNAALAESKRRLVLENMHKQGYLTFEEFAEALSHGLWYASTGPPPGPATLVYSRVERGTRYPYFVDYVRRYLVSRYGDEKVFSGGLRIQTTLDPRLQDEAEKQVGERLAGTEPDLGMALVAVEPPTGYVKALVGGRDFDVSKVNLALGGCPVQKPDPEQRVEVRPSCWDDEHSVVGGGTGRQPGSAFKPFTLATALAQGMSPSKVYPAPSAYSVPGCRGPNCVIHNNEGSGGGSVDLRRATWRSINTVYAQLVRDVGVKETAEMAKRLGVTSAFYERGVHGLSYTLGAIDVSPLDMASSFGVLATGGMRAEPTPVLKVVDADGNVLEDHTEPKAKRVVDQPVADNVTDVLKGVISSGTARRAGIGRPAAGKTGTTDNNTNAWFVGFTPTLSTAVWMGYIKEARRPLLGIKGTSRVYGGTIPASTWHDFMAAALTDVPVTDFNQPAPIKPVSDELKRQARAGIDPGRRRVPSKTADDCGGPCEEPAPTPRAVPPTTRVPPTTTTTTTPPFEESPPTTRFGFGGPEP